MPGVTFTFVSAAVSLPSLKVSVALISPLLPPCGSTTACPESVIAPPSTFGLSSVFTVNL